MLMQITYTSECCKSSSKHTSLLYDYSPTRITIELIRDLNLIVDFVQGRQLSIPTFPKLHRFWIESLNAFGR